MKAIIEWTLGFFGVLFIVWILWWAVKTLSYKIWHEDMVRAEIVKMVRPECLINGAVTIPDDVDMELLPGSKIKVGPNNDD